MAARGMDANFGWHFFPSAAMDRWMHDATDMDLLRQYADGNSDAAFAALVSRHVDLVFSAARRKLWSGQTFRARMMKKANRLPSVT
jgi:hypothetical protein